VKPAADVFSAEAEAWWDPTGPLRTLHALQILRAAYLRAREPDVAGRPVLDVGCGGGLMTEEWARRGARTTGLDRSPELLEVARQHASSGGLSIRYLADDLESFATREAGSYEVITAFEVVEHVPNPEEFVRALGRLLAPGGRLYLSTINRTRRSWLLAIVAAEYLLGLVPRGTHHHADFRRPSEVAAWSRAEGLLVEEIRGVRYHPFERRASFVRDVSVNYLMRLRRPGGADRAR
jgi:2-polyprenyl-6-hydroxyphenyl methylase/3-demethylubiquinone-9 3-methyltransferase